MAEPRRPVALLAWLGELRKAPARSTAVGALVIALASGLWQLPGAFRTVVDEARGLAAASALERELGGAQRADVDTRVFVERGG